MGSGRDLTASRGRAGLLRLIYLRGLLITKMTKAHEGHNGRT
jgi:hypothetical protein